MKSILMIALLILGAAFATPASAKTVKSAKILADLNLDSRDDGYSASLRFCYDLEAGTKVEPEQCRVRPEEKQRTCTVLVYNLSATEKVDFVPAGTVFYPTRQLGPEIKNDWDKRSSVLKVFLNESGRDHGYSNPNVVIECVQTFRNYRSPKRFTLKEVAAAVRDELELSW